MIESAEEFIRLRNSGKREEYFRSAHDAADVSTWNEVIEKYPDYKKWVIHNKTIPVEILEKLTSDPDPKIRSAIARKRKINDNIILILSGDNDLDVRYALMCNTKLGTDKLKQIRTEDSEWLARMLNEKLSESKHKK